MAVDLREAVQALLERKLAITRTHLRAELRAEIQAEIQAEKAAKTQAAVKATMQAAMEAAMEAAVKAVQVEALLSMAKYTGGLTELPALEAYRAKLAEMALSQLPSQDDFGNYLLASPEGEARVAAARRFLDDIL